MRTSESDLTHSSHEKTYSLTHSLLTAPRILGLGLQGFRGLGVELLRLKFRVRIMATM